MNLRIAIFVLGVVVAQSVCFGANPSWWTETETQVVETSGTASNFAPANLGQLKNVAKQAKKHLDLTSPGGAGLNIEHLVGSFEPRSGQGYTQQQIDEFKIQNYAPVNLGQLKAVAKPFYDRLLQLGYDTKQNLIDRGYPSTWAHNYPWDPATPVSENYAPANLGQLKMVFSFDLSDFDVDGNGLPDAWEHLHFGYSGVDPLFDSDGDGLTNSQEYQQNSDPNNYYSQGAVTIVPFIAIFDGNGQDGAEGDFLEDPLTVEVRNGSSAGPLLVNAPVTFTVVTGSGGLAGTNGSDSVLSVLNVSTGTEGRALAWYKEGPGGNINAVTAVTGSAAPVTFSSQAYGKNWLVAHWRFNDGSGVEAADSGPFGLTGALVNNPLWEFRYGGERSIAFNGTNQYMTVGSGTSDVLDFHDASFSVVAWVRMQSDSAGGRIVSKGESGASAGYSLATNESGQIQFGLGTTQSGEIGETVSVRTENVFDDNEWHHVAAVMDRSTSSVKIYVDGTARSLEIVPGAGGSINAGDPSLVEFAELSNLSGGNGLIPLTVSSHNGVRDFLTGSVDDVRVHKKALSAFEVEDLKRRDGTLFAVEGTFRVPEDTLGIFELQCNGGGEEAAVYSIVRQPGSGSLETVGPLAKYYPNAHFSGTDSFRFRASKGGRESEAEATIEVMTVDDPPLVSVGGSIDVTLSGSFAEVVLSGSVTDIDTEPENLTYTWSKVSGDGAVSFGDHAALSTTAAIQSPGEYVLRLTAFDGTSTRSDSLLVIVNANGVGRSSVSLTEPLHEAAYDIGMPIVLKAQVNVGEGATIEKVEFYEGSRKIGEALAAEPPSGQYTFNWTPVRLGVYRIAAKVTNASGHQSFSPSILVRVTEQDWFTSPGLGAGNEGHSGSGGNGGIPTGAIAAGVGGFGSGSGGRGGGNAAGGGGNGFGDSGSGSSQQDTDDDGLTDEEELQLGTNPAVTDTDGDGVDDIEDGWPLDVDMAPARLGDPQYIVIDPGMGSDSYFKDLSDGGHILYRKADGRDYLWSSGVSHLLPKDDIDDSGWSQVWYSVNDEGVVVGIDQGGVDYDYAPDIVVKWSLAGGTVVLHQGEYMEDLAGAPNYTSFRDPHIDNLGNCFVGVYQAAWEGVGDGAWRDNFGMGVVRFGLGGTNKMSGYAYITAHYGNYTITKDLTQNLGFSFQWNGGQTNSMGMLMGSGVVRKVVQISPEIQEVESETAGSLIVDGQNAFLLRSVPGSGEYCFGSSLSEGPDVFIAGTSDQEYTMWGKKADSQSWDVVYNSALGSRISGWPTSVNSRAEVLGYFTSSTGKGGNLIRDGRVLDLNDIIKSHHITAVHSMNEHGMIVATASSIENPTEERTVLAVPVNFSINPMPEEGENEFRISTDDAEQELTAWIQVSNMDQSSDGGEMVAVDDGTIVEWEIIEGDGTLSSDTSETENGFASTKLFTSKKSGESYKITAKIRSLKWGGKVLDLGNSGMVVESSQMLTVPGMPHVFEVKKSKDRYHSDATDTVDMEVSVWDRNQNALPDNTPVTWIIDNSTSSINVNEQGEKMADTSLTGGKAKLTLRAPSMPVPQNVMFLIDGVAKKIQMPVDRVDGTIASSQATLDVYAGGVASITLSGVTAANDTPVEWFASGGSISPTTGTIQAGAASAVLDSSGGWIGKVVVIAKVGDRLLIWSGQFASSAPVQVSFEHPVLVGGTSGPGQPLLGSDGNEFKGPWHTSTKAFIRAPQYGGMRATVNVSSGGSLVQLDGLDSNGQVTLDENGSAEILISRHAGSGLLGRAEINVSIDMAGALQRSEATVEGKGHVDVVDPTLWTHVGDVFGGLIGLDTTTLTGVVSTVVGGYLVVGDIGSIAKNVFRHAGWASGEPNNAELILAGVGILSTFVGPGDGVVGAIRAIVARIGKCPIADVLVKISMNIIVHSKMPAAGVESLIYRMFADHAFAQTVKFVLTSDELLEQAAKAFDHLGDPFVNSLKKIATAPTRGVASAQKFVEAIGKIDQEVMTSIKNSGKLEEALDGLSRLIERVDIGHVTRTLNVFRNFPFSYKQSDYLIDCRSIIEASPDVSGFDKLMKRTSKGDLGIIYETRIAKKLIDAGEMVARVGVEGFPATDIITSTHFVQCKLSAKGLDNYVLKKGLGSILEGLSKARSLGLNYKIIVQEGVVSESTMKKLTEAGIRVDTIPW